MGRNPTPDTNLGLSMRSPLNIVKFYGKTCPIHVSEPVRNVISRRSESPGKSGSGMGSDGRGQGRDRKGYDRGTKENVGVEVVPL